MTPYFMKKASCEKLNLLPIVQITDCVLSACTQLIHNLLLVCIRVPLESSIIN